MILLKLALLFERMSQRIKRFICDSSQKRFLQKYNLIDSERTAKNNIHYNPYKGTNVLLINALIESKEITVQDTICDVGCGTGIFLIYLAFKGYNHLIGYEINEKLYNIFQINLSNNTNINKSIKVFLGDFFEFPVDDKINCFYMFNPFSDETTYKLFFYELYKSFIRNKRKIKVLIYNPTVAFFSAIHECNWIKEKKKIIDSNQICQNCYCILVCETCINA